MYNKVLSAVAICAELLLALAIAVGLTHLLWISIQAPTQIERDVIKLRDENNKLERKLTNQLEYQQELERREKLQRLQKQLEGIE